jgi:hypothetical protein
MHLFPAHLKMMFQLEFSFASALFETGVSGCEEFPVFGCTNASRAAILWCRACGAS